MALRSALTTVFAVAWLTAAVLSAFAQAHTEVNLELVLAVDVSGSMDFEEHRLQRQGYVEGLRHPDIWDAIDRGAYQSIAVAYVEWAGAGSQRVIMPWRVIDTPEAARAFADDLAQKPISDIRGTSISGAIDFSAALFGISGISGFRKVIDVSGDGANNRGRPVVEARDEALAKGIVINGLPIMLRPSGWGWTALDAYYADCVIGGPGAFSLPVTSPAELTQAIRRKLVLEIALAPAGSAAPGPRLVQAQASAARTDCLVGERRRRIFIEP